ncbi:MAG TPA: hypothetical protein VF240_13825 [Pyrinomonadaceae bacterium]
MKKLGTWRVLASVAVIALCAAGVSAQEEQQQAVILAGQQLARVVPPGFYFEGQSAPTQTRNSAAARFGAKRHVIAGMVDTSGYSADVRAKYEGFFITDSPVSVGGEQLGPGAYGFGFTDDGKFNLFDVGGRPLLSVGAAADRVIRRPRPLMMTKADGGVRLYSGRQFVVITAR